MTSTELWGAGSAGGGTPLWRSAPGMVIPFSMKGVVPPRICPVNSFATIPAGGDDGAGTTVISSVTVTAATIVPDCERVTVCAAPFTYEVIPPGPVTDRMCARTTECFTPIQYESSPPTTTTNRICSDVSLSHGISYHATIGATATSDTVFRRKVLHCTDGFFLNSSANADAAFGDVVDGDTCPACPDGTTAYNPSCVTATSSLSNCTAFHLYHTETSCVDTSVFSCGDGRYFNRTSGRYPGRDCFVCKTCGGVVETACTATTDTVCAARQYLGTPPARGLQQCPPDTYRDDIGATVSPCLPCSRCPVDLIIEDCTRVHDTICGDFGSKSYVVEVMFILLISYTVWMSVFRIAVPIRAVLEARRFSEKSTKIAPGIAMYTQPRYTVAHP
jgi:hypothetical protein